MTTSEPAPAFRGSYLTLLFVAILACALGQLAYFLWTDYRDAAQKAQTSASNLSEVIASRISADFDRVDGLLAHVAESVAGEILAGRSPDWALADSLRLAGLVQGFDTVARLNIFDGSGSLILASHSAPPFSVADRKQFQILRDTDENQSFSEALISRATGQWAIFQLRAMRAPDGRFLGAVSAVFHLDAFVQPFAGIDVGPGGLILLQRSDDFRLIQRVPRLREDDFNQPLPPEGGIARMIEAGARAGNDSYIAGSDGVRRMTSFRLLDNYPFYVQVVMSADHYLAGWRLKAILTSTLLAALLVIFGVALMRLMRSEHRAEELFSRLQKIAALIPGMIYQLQRWPDGRVAFPYVSEGIRQIYGVEPASVREDASKVETCVHPEDRQRVRRRMEESAATLVPWRDEYRVALSDGRTTWVEGEATPERARDGSVLWHGYVRDISERKRAEEALRENQSLLSRAEQIAQLGSWILDLSSNRLTWSDGVFCIFGFEPQAFAATYEAFLEAVHPQDRDAVNEAYLESLREKRDSYEIEHRIVRRDTGEIRYVLERCIHERDPGGAVLRSIGMVQDITERKRTEAALRASEAKLTSLFSSMTEIVVIHDLVFDDCGEAVNYRITDCNGAFSKATGIAREQAVGKLATEVYGAAEPPYLSEFAMVATSGESHQYETYFPPLDRYFHISVVSPERNKFATIATDISDIKRAEAAIAAKNRELEQIVYVASHDLRSPLVNVDGYSRELEQSLRDMEKTLSEVGNASPLAQALRVEFPDMAQSLQYIRGSTQQMDALLKGLLKLSRSGRAALNIEILDMNGLFERVISSLDFQVREAGATVHVENLPACRGDAVQLTQVFTNLLDNALKYRDSRRAARITVKGSARHGRALYTVEDNGIGIVTGHQEKIFELFHRLEPSRSEGEGLGLTIVRQILGRLDGDIRVESTPGEGSRFHISLPSAPEKK